eukprot:CAMPEP_0172837850 /NCGR_PEP_ID=MMETSP1075-20121228/27481_1 /TAXON_ID=2916 /ORGANISM="Ceratium fusus, Strain PA161109" /LENGTH=63 /DNA_ID=CAMNT_0013681287 /DNA_START=224 /DNA_END=415 /DNA_ORIENTATION=-
MSCWRGAQSACHNASQAPSTCRLTSPSPPFCQAAVARIADGRKRCGKAAALLTALRQAQQQKR